MTKDEEFDFATLKKQREEVLEQETIKITNITSTSITTIHTFKDESNEAIYNDYGFCMVCNRGDVLGSGQTGQCAICDGVMTEEEYYEKFPKKELSPYKQIIKRQKKQYY